MESNQFVSNFIAMLEGLIALFTRKVEELPTNTILPLRLEFLKTKTATLKNQEAERKRLEETPAKLKKAVKEKLEAIREHFSGALLSLASDKGDLTLKSNAQKYSVRYNFRVDGDLKTNFGLLVADTRANVKDLVPYNVTEADVAAAEAMFATLPTAINQTATARAKRATLTQSRDELIGELRTFIRDSLTPTVNALKDEVFQTEYETLKHVRKAPGRRKTADAASAGQVSTKNATEIVGQVES